MPETVFFSWQADREPRGGRNFIERALEQACARISSDTSVEDADRDGKFKVDRDTKGVAGQPPIVETIFRKIDQAAVFVPDLTFVGKRVDDRPTPNPNVLVEYGWALNSLKHSRIVPVMNTAYGEPEGNAMPFDMRHLRNPITYHCPETLDATERRQIRQKLSKDLEAAIRLVLESPEYLATQPKPPAPTEFVPREAVMPGRFKPIDMPVGADTDRFRSSTKRIRVANRPARWFRLMPIVDPGRSWSVDELATTMQTPMLGPLGATPGGYGFLRSHEGFGIYAANDEPEQALLLVFAFTTGEVWSIDTYTLAANSYGDGRKTVPADENSFRAVLARYGDFLMKLGVKPPYRWEAGMENLAGRALYMPAPPGHHRVYPHADGECMEDIVSASGEFSPGDPVGPALKPFFEKLYNSCGLGRETWRDK